MTYSPLKRNRTALYFLKGVVAFPLVEAGEERQALTEIADRLCAELGLPGVEAPAEPRARDGSTRLFAGLLGPRDEELVEVARRSLTRISAALAAGHPKVVSETAYGALLDGAEVVMRNELAAGNRIAPLMPSFVFLISLPMVDQDQALELSGWAESLLAESGQG